MDSWLPWQRISTNSQCKWRFSYRPFCIFHINSRYKTIVKFYFLEENLYQMERTWYSWHIHLLDIPALNVPATDSWDNLIDPLRAMSHADLWPQHWFLASGPPFMKINWDQSMVKSYHLLFIWNVITHPFSGFSRDLAKLFMRLEHECIISSQGFM